MAAAEEMERTRALVPVPRLERRSKMGALQSSSTADGLVSIAVDEAKNVLPGCVLVLTAVDRERNIWLFKLRRSLPTISRRVRLECISLITRRVEAAAFPSSLEMPDDCSSAPNKDPPFGNPLDLMFESV